MITTGLTAPSKIQDISDDIEKLEPFYFAVGEVSDVYKCRSRNLNQIVAVKAMRGLASNDSVRQRFEEDLMNLVDRWETMAHPNVMTCYGICRNFGPIPALVFPMCMGSIMQYLEMPIYHDLLYLLVQIASAIHFLHSHGFVHGDIRGANIMMTSEGTPLLMDGGLSLIVSRSDDFTVAGICGPCRWMAPETLEPGDDFLDNEEHRMLFSTASDIYAFGMTILEMVTGKVPFNNRRYDTVVVLDVIRGNRPQRPEGIDEDLWRIITACWQEKPVSRPAASLVESWLDTSRVVKAILTLNT